MEGRALLAVTTLVNPAIPIAAGPTDAALTAANAPDVFPAASLAATKAHPVLAAQRQARAARRAARHDGAAPLVQGSSTPADGAGATGKLAVKTVWDGYWLTHSKDVGDVGLRYTKLSVAHDTRKVGAAYLGAAFRGDAKKLDQLGHTHLVKKVGADYSKLGKSHVVRSLGHKFKSLGDSVTGQYHKIFG